MLTFPLPRLYRDCPRSGAKNLHGLYSCRPMILGKIPKRSESGEKTSGRSQARKSEGQKIMEGSAAAGAHAGVLVQPIFLASPQDAPHCGERRLPLTISVCPHGSRHHLRAVGATWLGDLFCELDGSRFLGSTTSSTWSLGDGPFLG